MRNASAAAVLATVVLAGCATGGPVTVRSYGVSAPAKQPGCGLEVLQKPPARPYDVLAELESHVTMVPPEGALSVVKPKACELGADAIIVERNMVLNEFGHTLVAVTAIRWPTSSPPPAEVSPAAVSTVTPPPAEVSPSGASTVAPPAATPEEQHVPLNPREPKR
jgi:hypothetical protein